jgi:uncharacterized membrane protein
MKGDSEEWFSKWTMVVLPVCLIGGFVAIYEDGIEDWWGGLLFFGLAVWFVLVPLYLRDR